MAEPDHIFVKPLPNLARDDYPAGFPFFYMRADEHAQTVRKYFPEENGPVTKIDSIGNSPVIIKKVDIEFLIVDRIILSDTVKYVSFYNNTYIILLAIFLRFVIIVFVLFQSMLEMIAPTWMNVSLNMKADPETDKTFGWILDM